ncbi:MAG TPA: IS1182 family transposase [Acidimicrobiales bacterium]|jgi:IS5 family transposase|nr:IS1182 family transposase [Acidimicrobiales bacterium]
MQGKSDPNRELLDAAALCRQLVPTGSVEAFLADHRHQLFPDETFADLFPSGRGRPSIPADVIATVMVLQALEGLSDREAARAVRDRISWKVACGLALDDDGFDYSVLTYWRTRLRHSDHPERIFDAVREVIDATGVLAGRRRRALDSTILDDAVATQDTVTQLISAIRRVRRLVPEAAQVSLSAHDYDAGAKPVIAWDDPVAKQALITALVADALALVAALEPLSLSGPAADAVGLLALVAGQDVEPGDEPGTWRIAQRVAPDRTISTVDPEARHTRKSPSQPRDGYKAHVAVEPETGLVTDAVLTPANTSDAEVAPELLGDEGAGVEVLGDSAYGSGRLRAELDTAGHTATIKPIPSRPAVPGGFGRDDFAVDHETNTVTCPAGVTVTFGRSLKADFSSRCMGCPLRERCTTSPKGRTVTLNLYDIELEAARRRAETEEFQLTYRRWRPMVERTIAWVVAGDNRRLRYRGVARNHQWLLIRTAALNLRRLINLGLVHNGAWALAT